MNKKRVEENSATKTVVLVLRNFKVKRNINYSSDGTLQSAPRSGSLLNPAVSSSSRIQDSGRTEGNRLTDLAAGDAARLTAETNAPHLMGSGELSSPSRTPEKETYQTKEVCEPVESSGDRDEIVVPDFLIPTLTETLPPSCAVAGYSVHHLG